MVHSPVGRAFPLPKSSVPNLKNPAPFVKKTGLCPQFIAPKSPAIIVPRNMTVFLDHSISNRNLGSFCDSG